MQLIIIITMKDDVELAIVFLGMFKIGCYVALQGIGKLVIDRAFCVVFFTRVFF